MYLYLIILIILLLIAFFLFKKNNNENFLSAIKKIERTPSYLDDPLFSDIIPYDNDEDGRLGLDKCLANCNGVCLEYGVTGNANCFPNVNTFGKNYNTIMRDWENEVDEVDRAGTQLVYPSMR